MDDRPPMPFGRIAQEWSPQLPLYVNAQSAAYAIEELKSSSQTRGSDMYEALLGAGRMAGLAAPEVNDFVKRALREFGQNHARAIPRISSQGFVKAVTGMIEVWNALQEHQTSNAKKSSGEEHLLGQVINHSEGGFLLKFKPEYPALRAGSLLVMRGTENEPWTLCAIRWLQDNTRDVLVGVEVLSNFADARLCVDSDSRNQAPVITYSDEGQQLVYLPLGHTESKRVVQVVLDSETWVLSSVKELGEDWEMREALDVLDAT
jgi:hypothetical protein